MDSIKKGDSAANGAVDNPIASSSCRWLPTSAVAQSQ